MPIPQYTPAGVLPPYVGNVLDDEHRAPWRASASELVERFGFTPKRVELLQSLLLLRARFYEIGVTEGWQWIDGSFVEDAERLRHTDPRDIDIVTFANFKGLDRNDPAVRQAMFGRVSGCDAYVVNLANYSSSPRDATRVVQYWHGLFSHQRHGDLPLWKGFVEVPLSPDIDAVAAITLRASGASDDTH